MQETRKKSSRKTFYVITLILVLIFFVPLIFAWFLYLHQPPKTVKDQFYGDLIDPPASSKGLVLINHLGQKLPLSQWKNSWTFFYIAPQTCKQTCAHNLKHLYHAYLQDKDKYDLPVNAVVANFSGRDSMRIHQLIAADYPQLVHVYLQVNNFMRVFAHLSSKRRAMFIGMGYIVNPKGELVVGYSKPFKTHAFISDLNLLMANKNND